MKPAWKNRNSNQQFVDNLKPSAQSRFNYMKLYRNFLFEYSLMDIVKPTCTSTKRHKILYKFRNRGSIKNVRKTSAVYIII